MRQDDRSYFIRRAAEERAAAERATCPRAAQSHREMAERYALLVSSLREQVRALSA